VPRAAFTARELAELTIAFYRRNYIEGLFLSSAVLRAPDYTMERMIQALAILREEYHFRGYIHAKAIPGASPDAVRQLGLLADRMSVNIELPSEASLRRLAPDKTKGSILTPMALIASECEQARLGPSPTPRRLADGSGHSLMLPAAQAAPRFVPAGQSTQMIVGASPESDRVILRLAAGLYGKYRLRRVFYSAYVPVSEGSDLPALGTPPPLLREHRLYQADFLMRSYGFGAEEILTEAEPSLSPYLDPKCGWALRNLERFPVDVNRAPLRELLRVPGIGPKSVERIVAARRQTKLTTADLKRLGVVMKRAAYFVIAADQPAGPRLGHWGVPNRELIVRALMDPGVHRFGFEQLSLFGSGGVPSLGGTRRRLPMGGDVPSLRDAVEEAVACLANQL
jgi:putative DNA modification/repair radical SAM protein